MVNSGKHFLKWKLNVEHVLHFCAEYQQNNALDVIKKGIEKSARLKRNKWGVLWMFYFYGYIE